LMNFNDPLLRNDRFFGSTISTHVGYLWFIDGTFIKIISFETIHHIINGLKGGKNVLHEQHDCGGPFWAVHIFGPWVPKVIPWC
jgi:hypothetical protein